MANVEAGNQEQLIIKDLVESYSLSIGQVRNYGVVCAVSTLENIYERFGYHVLDRTLRLCVGTWEGDMNSLSANMLNGIEPVTSRAFAAYGRVVSGFEEECAALVQAVTEHTPLPERLAYIGLTGENTDVSVQL